MKKLNQKITRCLASAILISTGLSACGDLGTLLNNPQIQSTVQGFLDLYLEREVDGEVQPVESSEIQSIRADGQTLEFSRSAEGAFNLKDIPEDAQQLEILYADSDEAAIMPLPQGEFKADGRQHPVMRGLTRMKKGPDGKAKLTAHFGGFDQDNDGEFDADRPHFVQEQEGLNFHDPVKKQVKHFAPGDQNRFDFRRPPQEILEGDKFFLPQAHRFKQCGMLEAKADGSIDVALPTGEPRNLVASEFEITPEGVKILKAGEPDTGAVVKVPACGDRGPKPPKMEDKKPCRFKLGPEAGDLLVPRPDGSERLLKKGEYELLPDSSVKVLREGAPDMGKVVHPVCEMPPAPPAEAAPPEAPTEAETT